MELSTLRTRVCMKLLSSMNRNAIFLIVSSVLSCAAKTMSDLKFT